MHATFQPNIDIRHFKTKEALRYKHKTTIKESKT